MRPYFKGYYFKCSGEDGTLSLIPALHRDGAGKKASLQVITEEGVYNILYPNIRFGRRRFQVRMGPNYFSEKGLRLEAEGEGCRVDGTIRFGQFQKLRSDIMGPFQYIPWMQCRHSVISMRHPVTGRITVNGKTYRFRDGVGYIEGDRGRSFPREYAWTQCNNGDSSVMLAVADIPLAGFRFLGIIGVVMKGKKEYRIATYLGARVLALGGNRITVKQGDYTLTARLLEERPQKLNAPVNGEMIRSIHESVTCRAEYTFACRSQTLLEFVSDKASFEYEIGKRQKK